MIASGYLFGGTDTLRFFIANIPSWQNAIILIVIAVIIDWFYTNKIRMEKVEEEKEKSSWKGYLTEEEGENT